MGWDIYMINCKTNENCYLDRFYNLFDDDVFDDDILCDFFYGRTKVSDFKPIIKKLISHSKEKYTLHWRRVAMEWLDTQPEKDFIKIIDSCSDLSFENRDKSYEPKIKFI